jgi:hypothetical protein
MVAGVLGKKMIEFSILSPICSLNQIERMGWPALRDLERGYQWAIICAIGHPEIDCCCRCRVEILSRRARLLDPDNLRGGAKRLVDALRRLGWIWRDSPLWIDLQVEQVVDRANTRTEIKITYVDPERAAR